jgi:plastocyanin
MTRIFGTIVAGLLATAAISATLPAQRSSGGPHLIEVRLVDKPNGRYAFEPSVITAQPGDTLHFVQASSAPHDVAFRKEPPGAKLDGATTGPYLTNPGDVYDLVIDGRFTPGVYTFACDPHEALGMSGTLTVQPAAK